MVVREGGAIGSARPRPNDFATLKDAGLTLTGVPAAMGGVWHSAQVSTRPTGAIFRALAQVDPSVALVATMHPTVLALWLEQPIESPRDPAAWREQRERVLATAKAGHWFGTIASEPAGGGDLMATRATATRRDGAWRVTGDKHMGSGSGVTSFMITTAVPEGETAPDIFCSIRATCRGTARAVPCWSASGTDTVWPPPRATPFAMTTSLRSVTRSSSGVIRLISRIMPVIGYMFASVTMGILDAALAEARRRLQPRVEQDVAVRAGELDQSRQRYLAG